MEGATQYRSCGHDWWFEIGGYSLSTYAEFSEKLTFLTPWCYPSKFQN